jgi:hypothetical protein
MKSVIHPIDLKRTAAAVAANYGDDGAIIITSGPEGFRVGVSNMLPDKLLEALNIAIYHVVAKTLES